MTDIEPIKITGLAEFSRNLRKMDSNLPKGLRLANNEAAELVVSWAKPKVPRDSGRAAGTVKAKSTRTEGRVTGGSKRTSYYPWLDFGGKVGPKGSVRRSFIKEGRYIYPGFTAQRAAIADRLTRALIQVAVEAGIEVT